MATRFECLTAMLVFGAAVCFSNVGVIAQDCSCQNGAVFGSTVIENVITAAPMPYSEVQTVGVGYPDFSAGISSRCESSFGNETMGSYDSPAVNSNWYPRVFVWGQQRAVIKQTPIELRPNRPFHFYGNTIRRQYYRGIR